MKLTKVIITALELEWKKIIELYSLKFIRSIWFLHIYEGERTTIDKEKENIVLAICWEWKTQAAFATTYLCENYDFEKFVNIGIVGNLDHDTFKVWDVIIPNTFVQHDFYMPKSIDFSKAQRKTIFLEYAVWEEYDLEKFALHLSWICATWDQFIDNLDLASEIRETYWADIVDMEVYSILSVLRNYKLLSKAVVIKSVSDGADAWAEENSMANLEAAMDNAVNILDFTL